MRSRIERLGLAFVVFAAGPHPCQAGEDAARPGAAREAQELDSLRADIRKAVPSGWGVEVTLVDPERPSLDGPCPALVIRSEAPLEVEQTYPGLPAGGGPIRRTEPVAVRLVASPFLTARAFAAAREAARCASDERLAFVNGRLKGVPYASKAGNPTPPGDFRPRDDAERRLVLEYAFLSRRTETPRLPTHHAREIAFNVITDEYLTIRAESKAREYARIQETLHALLTPYE